jgi:hypothetical protein
MSETFCTIDWERLVRILAALLTPVIAIVATYIAFQQYQTNRRQHRLALFEKRMAVFTSTMNMIGAVVRAGRVENLEQLFKLIQETRDHEFLFGPEIGEYITEVYNKGVDLEGIDFEQHGDRESRARLLQWFRGQSATATEKFRKYLDFRKP